MRLPAVALWCCLALCLQLCNGRSFVEIGRDEEMCFVEHLAVGERLRGSYQVVSGGYLDIDLGVLQVQTQKRVVEQWRQEQGEFHFEADVDSDYKICFGNRQVSNAVKKIQFAIHAGNRDDLLEHEEDLAEVSHVDKLHSMVLRLGRRVSDLKEQEEYLRRRSERHHRTAESNNYRVLLSSVCEAFVLLAVNLAQIHYLRNFFEVKRMI